MNESIIWNYFIKRIRNPYGVAALMGNLFAESSLNPINATGAKKKFGLSNEEYTAITDAGKNDNFNTDGVAYGLAQWCYHTRKQALLEKARIHRRSVGNIYLQLDYLYEEIQKYKTVYKALCETKDIRSASDLVLLKYERPANKSEAVKIRRAKYGQNYFDQFWKPKMKSDVKEDDFL